MRRPLAFRSLKLRISGGRKNQGLCLTVRHCCSGCQEYSRACRAARRPNSCGSCGDGAGNGGVCPSCGVFSTSVKGRVTTSPRDIPYGEDRLWCGGTRHAAVREDYCERSSFTEAIAQVAARRGPPDGCAPRSARRSGRGPLGGRCRRWPRGVVADRTPRLRRPRQRCWRAATHPGARHRRDPPRKAQVGTVCGDRAVGASRPLHTGFVDPAGDQRLLGQREGRTGAAVVG